MMIMIIGKGLYSYANVDLTSMMASKGFLYKNKLIPSLRSAFPLFWRCSRANAMHKLDIRYDSSQIKRI